MRTFFFASMALAIACGGPNAEPSDAAVDARSADDAHGPDAGRDGGSGDAWFAQPTGLVVTALKSDGSTAALHATEGGLSGTRSFIVTTSAASVGGVTTPTITNAQPTSVAPMGTIVLTGTGFLDDELDAVSVLFSAPGTLPVAVPVIAATPTSLTLVAPALVDESGASVPGHATLRVLQVRQDAYAVSDPLDGVDVAALPVFALPAPRPGDVTLAYLAAALTQLDAITTDASRPLPTAYVQRVAALADALTELRATILAAQAGDPTSAPLPWAGTTARPTLDDATLALADRLVAALLDATFAAFAIDGTVHTLALAPCPAEIGDADAQLNARLCERQHIGETATRFGSAAVGLGFQVELAIFTGFYGAAASTVLSATSSARTALAFELVWAGLSGHIAAWVTASNPPTAGRTLADSGVTLLDTMVGSHGALGTLFTMLSFGNEYDALVRAAAPPPPDAGVPDDAGMPDDAPASSTLPSVLEGSFDATTDWPDACGTHWTLALSIDVDGITGQGTPSSPFGGVVGAVGSLRATPTLAGPTCSGGTLPITGITGTVGGSAGVLELHGMLAASAAMTFDYPAGAWDGTTMSGPATVTFADPRKPGFSGTLVMTSP